MIDILDDYDWGQAFQYAGEVDEESYYDNGEASISSAAGEQCDTSSFSRSDVVEIYGYQVGENDEQNWKMAGLLCDGRHFFLSAGCDYTGWD